MKNRLEEEYRQLKQSEAPDLWNRIEAGIDAGIENGIDAAADGKMKTQKKNNHFLKKYSLPLAACIAALMCVPLIAAGFFRILNGSSKSFVAEDTAPAENYATTAAESDEPLPEIYEEEVCEEAAYEDVADSASRQETVYGEDGTDDSGVAEDKLYQESEKKQVILTITGFSAKEETLEEGQNGGTICCVTTVEQGDCSIWVPADADFMVKPGQDVRIVVEPSDGSFDYVFVRKADESE